MGLKVYKEMRLKVRRPKVTLRARFRYEGRGQNHRDSCGERPGGPEGRWYVSGRASAGGGPGPDLCLSGGAEVTEYHHRRP